MPKKIAQPNTLWRHTAKGVARARRARGFMAEVLTAPADRIFAVVSVDGLGMCKAWKCTELPSGMISHPAYEQPLNPNDLKLFIERGRNGSEPTAYFKPDSHYKEITR